MIPLKWVFGVGLALSVPAALPQASQTPDETRQTALTLEEQGHAAAAEEAWRAYSQAYPADPEPYAHLGLLEARQEHYPEAVAFYRKALAINPNMPALRLNLGLALFKSGDLRRALPVFQEARQQLPPDSPDAQRLDILMGMAHYGLAEYDKAAPLLKQAAALDPQNLPLRLALAHSCLWSRQFQCVMDTYHEILTLNAESAEADMIAGEALDEMKDNEGSTKMFRAAVKANPKEPNVHFGLGYLLWTQKIYPEAATEFKTELANDPDHVQAMLYLADTDMQLNQPESARPLLEKVVQLDSSQWLAHLDLGILLSDANQNEAALRELGLAEKLKPNDVNVHWRLAKLYRAMGRKDEAKAEFDKASRLNKEADEDLVRKISNGQAPRAGDSASSPGPVPGASAQPQ